MKKKIKLLKAFTVLILAITLLLAVIKIILGIKKLRQFFYTCFFSLSLSLTAHGPLPTTRK